MACLATNVAEKKLVQASVDCTVAIATAVLEGRCCARLFSMGKACSSNVFVADLKLGTHELNEAHFVNEKNISFLENLDVCDGLPGKGGEAGLQRDVSESGVDGVEGRETGSCLAVGKGEARGLPCLTLVLALPGNLILVRCDRSGCVPKM